MIDFIDAAAELVTRGYSFDKFRREHMQSQVKVAETVANTADEEEDYDEAEDYEEDGVNYVAEDIDEVDTPADEEEELEFADTDDEYYDTDEEQEDEEEDIEEEPEENFCSVNEFDENMLKGFLENGYQTDTSEEPEEPVEEPIQQVEQRTFGKPVAAPKIHRVVRESVENTAVPVETKQSSQNNAVMNLPDKIDDYIEQRGKPVLIDEVVRLYGREKLNKAILMREVFKYNNIEDQKTYIIV